MSDVQKALLGQLEKYAEKPEAKPLEGLIVGASIPIKIATPKGNVKVQMHVPAEVATDPELLKGAMIAFEEMGMELDAWKPKNSGGWGSGGGNGRGYGNKGGGW